MAPITIMGITGEPEARAEERAEALLQTYLTPLQQEMRQTCGRYFYLYAFDGEPWILGDGWKAHRCNAAGEPHTEYHAAPADARYGRRGLPVADKVIGQLLALTTDPHYFVSTACFYNFTDRRAYPGIQRLIDKYGQRWVNGGNASQPEMASPLPRPPDYWPPHSGLWGVYR